MARTKPKPKLVSIYLGADDERETRVAEIKRLAEKYAGKTPKGDPAVSELIQMIADGELAIVDPKEIIRLLEPRERQPA